MLQEIPQPPPSPLLLGLLAAMFGPLGFAMLSYGLGTATFDWLHFNPVVPRLIFLLIGGFTLASTALILLQLVKAPVALINVIGFAIIGLSCAIMTVMAFGGGSQASCILSIAGSTGRAACDGIFKMLVVITDVIVGLAVAVVAVRYVGRLR